MKSVYFLDFIASDPICVPFIYTATLTDGVTAIDSTLFVFDGSNKEL